jgi:serine/threonine-protein kinase
MHDEDDDDAFVHHMDDAALPSAPLLTQLDQLRHHRDGKQRAWPVVAQAVSNPDGFGVVDFALEHDFVESLDGQPAQFWTNPIDGSEMVWIPGGTFYYGRAAQVGTLPGFSLARYPVTNQQFERFLMATRYQPSVAESTLQRDLFLAHC